MPIWTACRIVVEGVQGAVVSKDAFNRMSCTRIIVSIHRLLYITWHIFLWVCLQIFSLWADGTETSDAILPPPPPTGNIDRPGDVSGAQHRRWLGTSRRRWCWRPLRHHSAVRRGQLVPRPGIRDAVGRCFEIRQRPPVQISRLGSLHRIRRAVVRSSILPATVPKSIKPTGNVGLPNQPGGRKGRLSLLPRIPAPNVWPETQSGTDASWIRAQTSSRV